jgi:RND superfamily putative drug exporter
MISLAKLSIRRPKAALCGWAVVALALITIGFGVSHAMSPSITVVAGTQSARAQHLAEQQFGPAQLVPILLEGPKAELNRVGPRLVIALNKRPHTRTLSAWDAGTAGAGLRPSPTAAMIVASVDRTEKNVVNHDQPQIERLVTHVVGSAPIKPYITGQPSIDRALRDAAINDLRRHELIAAAIVFFVLLIGLRAPVAAILVTVKAAASMLAAFGEVAILGHFMRLDVVGIAAGSMTGLAVAVAFGLLILDRFRNEQLADGRTSRDYATAAMLQLETTGRAVLVGGTGLVLALALVAIIGPTQLMVSVGAAALASAAFATGAAVVVMPAALVLLGRRLELLNFPAPGFLHRIWDRVVGGGNWVVRHAVYAGFAATAILAALAVPAFAINTGQPSVGQLPTHATARVAFEEVSRVMGPGWATPYDVIVVPRGRPITTPAVLASLVSFQRQIAHDKTVASVVGPGSINGTSNQLKKFGPSLIHSAKVSNQSKRDLVKLIDGLGQAGAGSAKLQSGLEQAVSGANRLHGGSGQAAAGAAALHNGLAQAKSGSDQLEGGLNQALSGARRLKTGAAQALSGSAQLLQGISLAQGPASQSLPGLNALSTTAGSTRSQVAGALGKAHATSGAIAAAEQAVAAIPDTPGLAAAKLRATGALARARSAAGETVSAISVAAGTARTTKALAAQIAYQAPGLFAALNMLHDGAAQLQSGLSQLRDGNAQLADGIGKLAGGGGQLRSGLGRLTSGAGQLQAGLQLLTNGAGQLAFGLSAAPGGAGQLTTGLGQMQAAVIKARGQIPSTKDLETLLRQSPGMFSNGYFVLSAIAGAPAADRNQASFAINLVRGGTAGQIVVVSNYASNDPRSEALRKHLVALSATFAKQQNADVAVGGPGKSLDDLTNAANSKIWIDVIVIAGALVLVLALALRAIVLPVAAVMLNLLVVAAAFGVVEMLFGGSNPPLGGPGYLDPITIISIFSVAFGISVSYSTVVLMRTREAYERHGNPRTAARAGLNHTAAAATGAAIAMVAAMIPFATTELINVRELGVGVGVAVLLVALLLRPVLLPAAEVVLGRIGWWPTRGPRAPKEPPPELPGRRPARMRLPHGRPRPQRPIRRPVVGGER